MKYVGQTKKTMNKRWQEHIAEANRMSSCPLHKAFRKYGIGKFTIKQIDECNENLLDEKEQYWIQHYKSFEDDGGYNSTIGGKNTILSEKFKERVSVAVSNVMLEKRTDEWNDKIKQSHLKRKEPFGFMLKENRGDGKHTAKRVLGINIETGEEKIWESFTAAALEVAGDKKANSNIHEAVKNGTKAFGYRWRRLDPTSNKTPIKGVHKITWEEIYFDSISEASRAFGTTNLSGIQNSLRNPHKYSYKKYYWFYDE